MVTQKTHRKILLVLVPHRDVRVILRNYSACLFNAGFSGAFSFPHAAVLARISKALNDAELKHFTCTLREIAGNKIFADKSGTCAFGKELLYGPLINIDGLSGALNETEKVTEIFPHPVIGSCLLPAEENAALPAPPQLSFRAAAVANMYWSRTEKNGAVNVKWKIGKLCWLPTVRKKA